MHRLRSVSPTIALSAAVAGTVLSVATIGGACVASTACSPEPLAETQAPSSSSSTSEKAGDPISSGSTPDKAPPRFEERAFQKHLPGSSMPPNRLADSSSVGGFCVNGGVAVGVCVAQNRREYQEDSWLVLGKTVETPIPAPSSSLTGRNRGSWWWSKLSPSCGNAASLENSMAVFAAFDGHGGDACSAFVTRNFQNVFENELGIKRENSGTVTGDSIATALERTLLDLDREFVAEYQRSISAGDVPLNLNPLHYCGTTAVVVAVHLDEAREIVCTNVGDSRAILIRGGGDRSVTDCDHDKKSSAPSLPSPVPLSDDHNPRSRPDEVERIERLGGEVRLGNSLAEMVARASGAKLPPRVYHRSTGVGGLNMTRALGDDYLKPLVSAEPETTRTSLNFLGKRLNRKNNDSYLYLVVATDGLWDVMSNQDVEELVLRVRDNAGRAVSSVEAVQWSALLLVQGAQQRGSRDNITCMVVQIPL